MKIKKKKSTLNFLKEKSINVISRVFLSSFIIISYFYIMPIFINFTEKNFNTKEFTNNSNKILNNTLNQNKIFEDNEEMVKQNEIDLLYDILDENNSDINVVRYTTSEINALFKKINYNLEDVRDTKLVKPVPIDLLPNEIKTIENTKKKKRNVYQDYFAFNLKRK